MTGCAGGLSGGLWAVHGAALEPGAPFQQKPFAPESLARKVREMLDAVGKGLEELQEVDGIGPKTYAQIAPHVRV